ncbi:MAG: thiamine phosphate synthase [Gammaproteobacteria bacterium HGW-Gammaproteobacteria-14]|nr:MAG: thiamine phosphate synthase [Gammaproteobacteria bacterium HGW-Gammaproteobacteria-14]
MAEIRGLYAITDPRLLDGSRLLTACEAALRGGARILQYRDKPASDTQRRQRALELLRLCRDHGALFIINDDSALAADIGADGVHIGQSDGDLSRARQRLGPDAIIGVTCHGDPALAHQAVMDGANYVAFGRFYPSLTKPHAMPADPAVLATRLPMVTTTTTTTPIAKVAIGGITPDNAPPLLKAGADALAVIHGLFGSDDIEARARQFSRLFNNRL